MRYLLTAILAAGAVRIFFITLSWLANVIAWIREGKRDKKRDKKVSRIIELDEIERSLSDDPECHFVHPSKWESFSNAN